MPWRDLRQAWPEGRRVGDREAAWRLARRLGRWAGPAALAAGAALALYLGLRDVPSRPMAQYQVGYQCWRNAYDCRDFRTQAEAQVVYQACGGAKNDVHHLDLRGTGRACEHLP